MSAPLPEVPALLGTDFEEALLRGASALEIDALGDEDKGYTDVAARSREAAAILRARARSPRGDAPNSAGQEMSEAGEKDRAAVDALRAEIARHLPITETALFARLGRLCKLAVEALAVSPHPETRDAQPDAMQDTGKVTRFELVDHRTTTPDAVRGRVFSAMPCRVELSYQDQGRTLKVFVDDQTDSEKAP